MQVFTGNVILTMKQNFISRSHKEEKDIVRKVKFMTMLAPMSKVKVVKEPVASTTIKDMDALEAFLKGL